MSMIGTLPGSLRPAVGVVGGVPLVLRWLAELAVAKLAAPHSSASTDLIAPATTQASLWFARRDLDVISEIRLQI